MVVDGFKFASEPEALRYENLKQLAGSAGSGLTCEPSQDGRLLVCTWESAQGPRTQGFCLKRPGRNKFNAVTTPVGDLVFRSGHEARRFIELTYMQAAGEIRDLVHHPPSYDLVVNEVLVGRYTPDFTYTVVATGVHVVEDAKSDATRAVRDYPLRKKLMLACHGIQLAEVYEGRR